MWGRQRGERGLLLCATLPRHTALSSAGAVAVLAAGASVAAAGPFCSRLIVLPAAAACCEPFVYMHAGALQSAVSKKLDSAWTGVPLALLACLPLPGLPGLPA
jgi:hypothetical protein